MSERPDELKGQYEESARARLELQAAKLAPLLSTYMQDSPELNRVVEGREFSDDTINSVLFLVLSELDGKHRGLFSSLRVIRAAAVELLRVRVISLVRNHVEFRDDQIVSGAAGLRDQIELHERACAFILGESGEALEPATANEEA